MKRVVFRYGTFGQRMAVNGAVAAVAALSWISSNLFLGVFFLLVAAQLLFAAARVSVRIDGHLLKIRNTWGSHDFDLTSQDVQVWIPGPPPYSFGAWRQALQVRTSVDDWVSASSTRGWNSRHTERKLRELTVLLSRRCEGGAKLVVGGEPPARSTYWFDG